MESHPECGSTRNDVLSQSYVESIQRVAQQKNDGGLGFVLPKEVLEEREQVWSQLFHKYNKAASDDVELDINTLAPIAAEGDEGTEEAEDKDKEEEDDDDDDEDEGEEDKQYDSKCHAPLRKLPALIQYWIDTGNPPYRLVGADDDTETGSSLSEGEHSRSGQSAVLRESSDKQKSNTSRCSSVDTAAYILSNTNITKKAEAMAIVEGAKSSDDRFVGKVSPLKETSAEFSHKANNTAAQSPNRDQRSQLNDFVGTASKSPNVSSPGQQSVKLSEILPELQEFDEMLQKSSLLSSPRTCRSLNAIPGNLESGRNVDASAVSEPKNQSGLFPDGRKKLQNRRKLYTGRNSPVDIVIERSIGHAMGTVRRSLHPALEAGIPKGDKAAPSKARVRTRRKRKRASQFSEIYSQDGNTSQQSDQPVEHGNSKSDARYTDFFESLGLTPSKIIAGKPRVRRPAAKRSKIIEKRVLRRKAKDVASLNVSMESSLKESGNNSQTEDSALSPVTKDPNTNVNSADRILCGKKTLRVRIERLSDECLARYSRRIPSNTKHEESGVNDSQICSSSSGRSPGKKVRRLNREKIEVLTTATHDSDSSTILICACNEIGNTGKYDGDDPTFSKDDLQMKRKSLKRRGHKSSVKDTSVIVKSVDTKNCNDKLPETFVQLEKLNIQDLQKTAGNLGNPTIKFKTSLSPRSPDKRRSKSDLFGPKASAIGNRFFGTLNGDETTEKQRQKLRATRSRCTLGILVPSDDEDDNFVKLISEIGSKPSSTKVKDKQNNSSNWDGKIGTEKSQSQFAISTSSDEDDVDAPEIRRRTRNLQSRNQNKRRERRKTDGDLVQEMDIEVNPVKLSNPLDASNCKKLPSEKTARVEREADAENRKTRGSKSRSKTMSNSFPASDGETEMEIEDSENRVNSHHVRRSTRHNSSISRLPKDQLPAKDLGRSKSTKTKNLFATLQKPDEQDTGLPAWVDRDLNVKDDNMGTRSSVKIADQSEESESRSIFRNADDLKRIVKVPLSSRFQTRLDSDSDAEFEGVRFSLNEKHTKRSRPEEVNDTENTKSKGPAGTRENEPEIEETEVLRNSTRQFSRNLAARRQEMSEKKFKKGGRNLFSDRSVSAEEGVYSFQNEAMDVETSANNGLVSPNELPKNGMKYSPVKETKAEERKGESFGRKSRKNSTKSERSKNQSPIAKHRNGASRVSPLARKNNVRRTRILGKPTEWASDDDTDSNDNKINSYNTKQDKSTGPLANGDSTKQSTDDRRSTKNFFSTSAEDVDPLFDVSATFRGNKNAVVITKLNFASTKKHKNLDSIGSSTTSFRTRLRSDTEDDEQS